MKPTFYHSPLWRISSSISELFTDAFLLTLKEIESNFSKIGIPTLERYARAEPISEVEISDNPRSFAREWAKISRSFRIMASLAAESYFLISDLSHARRSSPKVSFFSLWRSFTLASMSSFFWFDSLTKSRLGGRKESRLRGRNWPAAQFSVHYCTTSLALH